MTRAYEEIVDFIAGGTSASEVAAFVPSEASRQSISDLLQRQKLDSLSAQEKSDLAHYLEVEHIMRLAKARARQHLP